MIMERLPWERWLRSAVESSRSKVLQERRDCRVQQNLRVKAVDTKSTLIVCTKDRPVELFSCLASVLVSTNVPNEVIVVDSSSGHDTELLCAQLCTGSLTHIHYYRSAPGLTHQRNFGLSMVDACSEIVHFLDDDTIVDRQYFTEIETAFLDTEDAVAVGGRVVDMYRPGIVTRIWERAREGSVSSGGINYVCRTVSPQPRTVDWLSGCSMSFRSSVFERFRFDERRLGNGVGEDVDFCLRAGSLGRIIWVASAELQHRQSPINRYVRRRQGSAIVDHRFLLAKDNLHGISIRRVKVVGIGEAIVRMIRSILIFSPDQWQYSLGMLDSLLGGRDPRSDCPPGNIKVEGE